MDDWAGLDAWCKRRADKIKHQVSVLMMKRGKSVDDPEVARLVGRGNAYGEIRSYIHSARANPIHPLYPSD